MRGALVALSAALALAVVPAAAAKDVLLFDRPTAHVGDTLVLTTQWSDHPRQFVVWFMPLAASPKFWPTYQGYAPGYGKPPRVRGAIRLGTLTPLGGHRAELRFVVPRVKPGRYVLGFWCIPCGTYWTSALPNFQPNPRGILRVLA